MMKKIAIRLLSFFILLTGLTSCGNDDDFPRTGENGRPSIVKRGDDMYYFSYDGDRISQIRMNDAFVTKFVYTNGELTGRLTYPIDERIADGNGSTTYIREGNKIRVETWGEPSFSTYVTEIELDDNDIPVKITELGFTVPKPLRNISRNGKHYALLSFDPATKRLLKEEIYLIETSEKVATYTFEYADTPGAMSKVNLPLWYLAYQNHWPYGRGNDYDILYFNHSGNLVKKIADDDAQQFHAAIEYMYDYDAAGFPVRMVNKSVDGGEADVSIRY